MAGLVGVLVTVGMVVVAPLGLGLLATVGVLRIRPVWPVLGAVAGAGLLLPRGWIAVAAVLPYAAACAAVTGCGVLRVARIRMWRSLPARKSTAVRELTALTATVSLSVAGLSLVAERAGVELLGFSLALHGLTVAHFHFAGFAAALLAGLTAVAVPGRLSTAGAVAVPAGTAAVALGHFTGRWTELAGALVLTVGLLATSWVAARHVAPRVPGRMSGTLLQIASWATPVTMLLALHFALGRATGIAHLSIPDMAATHGVINALGVGVCGLLGWRRVGGARL